MMSDLRQAAQAALAALEEVDALDRHKWTSFDRAKDMLRAALAAPQIPTGMKLFPAWKGYALLGTGRYAINHSAPPADPTLGAELFITFATEAEKSGGRQVGERRDNPPDAPPVQPEDMVIRIGFLSERAVFALEDQLLALREEHGWNHSPRPVEVTDAMIAAALGVLFDMDSFGPTDAQQIREDMRAALTAALEVSLKEKNV